MNKFKKCQKNVKLKILKNFMKIQVNWNVKIFYFIMNLFNQIQFLMDLQKFMQKL